MSARAGDRFAVTELVCAAIVGLLSAWRRNDGQRRGGRRIPQTNGVLAVLGAVYRSYVVTDRARWRPATALCPC